jgi:hypothetical protein
MDYQTAIEWFDKESSDLLAGTGQVNHCGLYETFGMKMKSNTSSTFILAGQLLDIYKANLSRQSSLLGGVKIR